MEQLRRIFLRTRIRHRTSQSVDDDIPYLSDVDTQHDDMAVSIEQTNNRGKE
jgi:hypothetical protein